MRVKILVDGEKPKVSPSELRATLEKAGVEVRDSGADLGVVVGGDGRFGRYGRTEDIPLLFVGVRSNRPAGSKAYLAEAYYDELPAVLEELKKGGYKIEEHPRLEVLKNAKRLGEVFTDVYLERGDESTCIRYKVVVKGGSLSIEDAAIGDGVVITTAAGSTGYYSYVDRIRGEHMEPGGFAKIPPGEVGICHVVPTYTEREGSSEHPLRYTVPWGSTVELSLFRLADARLYGTSDDRAGIRVAMGDRVTIRPGQKTTKLVRLGNGS